MENLKHYDVNVEVRPVNVGAGLNGWYQLVRFDGQHRVPVTDWQCVDGEPMTIVHHAVRAAQDTALAQLARIARQPQRRRAHA
ncbi:hypothetical protein JCM19000A_11100 [Silvimonas sp. JCM 19000]